MPTQQRTTLISIAAASLLVALKLGVGLATGSLALFSAGIESSGDVIAAVLTFFAVRLGGRPADREHPYGHRRAENLGALGESMILLAGGLLVGAEAVRRLSGGGAIPETIWYAFAVPAVALGVDLSRTIVTLRQARRHASAALRSNALHFAGDMAGSVAVLCGLLAVSSGYRQGDAAAALIVAAIMVAAAVELIAENANVLMDRSPLPARQAAESAIAALGGDIELSRLRLRESAGRYFADVVVSVPPGQAVVEGHRAADEIEAAIEQALPGSDVVVHVEPRRRGLGLREQVLAIALAEPLVKEAHDVSIFEQRDAVSVSLHLKFPPDVRLRAAHEVAERIERAIRDRLDVADAQTHLEPLELTRRASGPAGRADDGVERDIEQLVGGHDGALSQQVRLLSTDAGRVVFLTLGVRPEASLADAHRLAGELEEELRARIDGIAEVVVHTEPHAPARSPDRPATPQVQGSGRGGV
jgi:cation diffusion facilitator family transporter